MSGIQLQTETSADPSFPGTAPQHAAEDASSLAAALQEQEWCSIADDDRTLYSFLNSLPGMACQIRLDAQDALHLSYVSEGCRDLLGIAPHELQEQPSRLIDRLHPEDTPSFIDSMHQSAAQGSPWNWEGRIVLPASGETKWVNLRAIHQEKNPLGTVWKGFLVNITRNKQAEIELEHSRQRLYELSSHIESIKEEERTRIAREIHDEIGVLLTALKMDLAWVAQRLPEDNSALQEKTRGMANLLDTAGQAANNLVHSLRPGSLDCFGIVAAIEIEADEFTKRTGIPCKVVTSSEHIDVTDEQSITLFRVFQEALNNIMKHAAATQVTVALHATGEAAQRIELTVADDGCGFDQSAQNKPRSFGLRGIQERISQLGGDVEIASSLGHGTAITVRLPAQRNTQLTL